jgi:prepilin-type N-terminal cleavage/methylation domain-containing protein
MTSGTTQKGFTLFEVMVVISLVVFMYAVAIPNFSLKTGTEAATKIGQLTSDVRSAFDMAVLSGYPHRLVFELASGDYWLEKAETRIVYLGDDKLNRDPTEEEEKGLIEFFDERFKEYEGLAGEEITDPETGNPVKPTSPVIEARNGLSPTEWERVDTLEWKRRQLGPYYLIKDMQSEHHHVKQTLEDAGPKGRAFLYFYPNGYVQKAVIHLAARKGEMEVDDSEPPYTITTTPWEGTAQAVSGYEEVDVLEDRDEN